MRFPQKAGQALIFCFFFMKKKGRQNTIIRNRNGMTDLKAFFLLKILVILLHALLQN
jgi:hypothetical protein